MAKRYHNGNSMLINASYDGYLPRKKQNKADGAMIAEAPGNMSGLPMGARADMWPRTDAYRLPDSLSYGINTIDDQIGTDHRQMMKSMKPLKI